MVFGIKALAAEKGFLWVQCLACLGLLRFKDKNFRPFKRLWVSGLYVLLQVCDGLEGGQFTQLRRRCDSCHHIFGGILLATSEFANRVYRASSRSPRLAHTAA